MGAQDDRIRLEGKLEQLEAAFKDLERLEAALGEDWADRLPFRLDAVARVLDGEAALEALIAAAEKLETTRALAESARAARDELARKVAARLAAVGASAKGPLDVQLRQLLDRTPLAHGFTAERTHRGVFPLVGLGVAALGAPLFGSGHFIIVAGLAVGSGLVASGFSAWRALRGGTSLWMLECDRIAIYPSEGEPWAVPLNALTRVEIASNRTELHLFRTPVLADGRGTPVVPLATTAVGRVAGLLELYRTLEWQTSGRWFEGDCALVTAALTPGLQGWALVGKVGAVFVRDGASAQATEALTGRQVHHLLGEDVLLRELGRLPDSALKVLMPLLDGVEGCAFLGADELKLELEPRVHLWTKTHALTLGAAGEDLERLRRWYPPA